MKKLPFRAFTKSEHEVWHQLFQNLDRCRKDQAVDIFAEGLAKLGITGDHIPDLNEVNQRLASLTGWQAIPVEGLEESFSFFHGLSERQFPIGNFIRDAKDLAYTPAPDVFHDLYGHLPFLADKSFALFCENLGKRATRVAHVPFALDLWGRLFWYGVEFSLLETRKGRRIFGGGILSSYDECQFSLSPRPEVLPFSVDDLVDRPYKIDEFQKVIYCLSSPDQLYRCLDRYEQLVHQRITPLRHAAFP